MVNCNLSQSIQCCQLTKLRKNLHNIKLALTSFATNSWAVLPVMVVKKGVTFVYKDDMVRYSKQVTLLSIFVNVPFQGSSHLRAIPFNIHPPPVDDIIENFIS